MRLERLLWFLVVGSPAVADDTALVPVGQVWRFQLGTEPPSVPATAWRLPDFKDSPWLCGPSGFTVGLTSYPVATRLPDSPWPYVTAFFRTEFVLVSPEMVKWLVLRIDYDDAFVAHLNGVEVARRGFGPEVTVAYDTPAPLPAQIWGEEIVLTAFTNVLAAGTNVLAVEVHKSSPQDSALALLAELLANFTRGPFVQNAATNQIQIIWKTPVSTDSQVDYGTNSLEESSLHDTNLVTTHVATLSNLLPGTVYRYRVSSSAEGQTARSSAERFQTLRASGPITFVVLADSGTGSLPQQQIARVMLDAQPDLVLHAGDILYPDFRPNLVDSRCFSVYRWQMRTTPFFFTYGNHELYAGDAHYLEALYLPTNAATGTEHFYSFDDGEVHFCGLFMPMRNQNANYLQYALGDGTPQYAWLTNDLAQTSKPWKILFFHTPLTSSGPHRWDGSPGPLDRLEIQRLLLPILERYGVQLVLSAHDHVYERFAPMHGAHSVVCGGGGSTLYSLNWLSERDIASARFWSVYHCLKVRVDSDALLLQALDVNGTVFDEMTIYRPPPPPRLYATAWHSPVVESQPADDHYGNIYGQSFDFAGDPIPTMPGKFSNLGRVYVNNDRENLYVGFKQAMIYPQHNLFLFIESPRQIGAISLRGLGNGVVDPEGEGADGLDFLENLSFTNFAPSIACLLGDELADGQFCSFARTNLPFNIGQGVFRLDPTFSDVPGTRLQQFNLSPQTGPLPGEQNADFIEVAIPLKELGGLRGGEVVRLGALVGMGGVNTNHDQQARELDSAFLGLSLTGSGEGPVVLEAVRVQLAADPDPDSDGLTTEEELRLGTDPFNPDSDGDGLLDGWEIRHGLNPLFARGDDGPQGDPDGDGFSNAAEQIAGTDPRVPASALRVRVTLIPPHHLRISWEAVIGKKYQLQASNSAASGFVDVVSTEFPRIARSTAESYEEEPPAPQAIERYFRIRVVE